MAYANESQFRKPHVRLLALGLGHVRGSSEQTINGGISSPMEYVIPRDTSLYRFGQNGVPALVLAGEWWIDGDAFNRIAAFARLHSMTFREGLRKACFIPEEWGSALDTAVYARTKGPLLAYRGKAAVVSIKGAHGQTERLMNAQTEPFRVPQLYIPGLGSADVRREALGAIQPIFLPA